MSRNAAFFGVLTEIFLQAHITITLSRLWRCGQSKQAKRTNKGKNQSFTLLLFAGEELCISYVDDELPYDERHRMLEHFYKFECKCIRCYVQKEKIPIIQ